MTDRYRVLVAEGDQTRVGLAMQMVALKTGIVVDKIAARDRYTSEASRARWLSMYLSHIGYGWPIERVGHAFGFNRTTVATACRWAEDARDRPEFDRLIERMEMTLRELCEAPNLELVS